MPYLQYILYGTANCHLCENAINVIQLTNADIDLLVIDIMDNHELYTRYERIIPVLKCVQTGVEIQWPFQHNSLMQFFNL